MEVLPITFKEVLFVSYRFCFGSEILFGFVEFMFGSWEVLLARAMWTDKL